jgi:hypothetical protein
MVTYNCIAEGRTLAPNQGYNITQKFKFGNGKGEEKEIIITASADGIWQFGDENERRVAGELDHDSDRAAAIITA